MSELTNLLPPDRVHALRQEYRIRLAGVVAGAISVLFIMHAVLLTPSYLYLSEEKATRAAHLESLSAATASSEEDMFHKRIETLTQEATRIAETAEAPSASGVIRQLLTVAHSDIRVSGIAVDFSHTQTRRVRVSGVASTRDALRQYRDALAALPEVSSADLPLSVYAQERDLAFSIVLSGTLLP